MSLDDVNLLAVLLATVLAFALGGLWYSPVLFARPWMAAHGFTDDDLPRLQAGARTSYLVAFGCWLVMATVLAMIAAHFGDSVGTVWAVGMHLWLGFTATTGLTTNRFSHQPLRLWVIDAGYQVASISVMAVVLGMWR